MAKTTTWQIPYPDLASPADIQGVDGVDDLAQRVDVCLTQIRAQGAIPGEVKLWPGGALPVQATYGHWVWADGVAYSATTYPLAAGNIAAAWKTFGGAADPGAGMFRVPDMRGMSPAGLDQMPGGARANRTTRSVAIVLAGRTGEEYHTITLAESAAHAHGLTADSHAHGIYDPTHPHGIATSGAAGSGGVFHAAAGGGDSADSNNGAYPVATGVLVYAAASGVALANAGGGGAHENVPPTVYVPYIVKLDD
jgi:microcystin-dependent protein